MAPLEFTGIHARFLADRTPELDLEGGRMSGKTWVCSAKIWQSCLDHPGIWWLICRYSGTETASQLRPQFMQVCRMLGVEPRWDDDESAYCFPKQNGKVSKVFAYGLKTQSKDARYAKIRGSGFAGVWNDQSEELPEDIGTEIRALLRQPGYPHQLIFSPNPPDEEHFLADQFPDDQDLPGRKLYRLSLYDNQHNLPADTIEKMEKAYPSTHAKHKSLILGLRGPNITGIPVYEGAFRREDHVVPLAYDPSLALLEAIHAGQHHPVWLAGQRSRFGGINLLAGIIGKRLFLEDFIPIVHSYRYEFFDQGPKRPVLCCDPPPNRDDMNRYTSVNLLRAAGLTPRYRENANSPDVRESVVQTIGGMMKRRMGSTYGFAVSDDENRWLMISDTVTKHSGLFVDGLEGSYVWDPLMVSVANKQVRQPKVDQWLEGLQRCLENMVLNFCAGQLSIEERVARRGAGALRHRSDESLRPVVHGKAPWMV